jgi:hypothetical protein
LLEGNGEANIHQGTLTNFIPTRPLEDIAREYVKCFWELYEPKRYLGRVYRHCLTMKPRPHKKAFKMPGLPEIRGILTIFWRQGIKRDTRWQFWYQIFSILRQNPRVFESYITNCAHLEHFIEYRQIVRHEIEEQLDQYLAAKADVQSSVYQMELTAATRN